jgi:glutamyl/glutaminyl-tRNA synthetase
MRWLGFSGTRVLRLRLLRGAVRHRRSAGEKGKAYVDSQNEEEIRTNRGTVTIAGDRARTATAPVDENLDLLRRMKAGEFEDGAHVLRAKIDWRTPT